MFCKRQIVQQWIAAEPQSGGVVMWHSVVKRKRLNICSARSSPVVCKKFTKSQIFTKTRRQEGSAAGSLDQRRAYTPRWHWRVTAKCQTWSPKRCKWGPISGTQQAHISYVESQRRTHTRTHAHLEAGQAGHFCWRALRLQANNYKDKATYFYTKLMACDWQV